MRSDYRKHETKMQLQINTLNKRLNKIDRDVDSFTNLG